MGSGKDCIQSHNGPSSGEEVKDASESSVQMVTGKGMFSVYIHEICRRYYCSHFHNGGNQLRDFSLLLILT